MAINFNSCMTSPAVDYMRELCLREGVLRHYDRDEAFFTAGNVARYFGYIQSGTLKYAACGDDGTDMLSGSSLRENSLQIFPFRFEDRKQELLIAETPCEIYCVSTIKPGERLKTDSEFRDIVLIGTEAIFPMVYDRYVDLHCKTTQQRYNDLIPKHTDLFSLFPLKDIASFLNFTPTYLSRLRKNNREQYKIIDSQLSLIARSRFIPNLCLNFKTD